MKFKSFNRGITSGKKEVECLEPRECLFTGLQSKLLVESVYLVECNSQSPF